MIRGPKGRGPIRNLLGIGMGGHIRALYIVPEVNGGLYMAPEVRELFGWGDYQEFIWGTRARGERGFILSTRTSEGAVHLGWG